jgi:hypothetical protein
LSAGGETLQLREGLLPEQSERRNGCEQERPLRRQQQRQRSDRHDQHAADTTRDAAARVN